MTIVNSRQCSLICITCVFLAYLFPFVHTQKYDWQIILSRKIKEEVKSASVVTFGSFDVDDQFNLLRIIDAPVMNFESIDGQSLLGENNTSFTSLTSEYSRSPHLFIILKKISCIDSLIAEIEGILSSIIQLFPYPPRPKCLLLLSDSHNSSVDYLHLRHIFLIAWHHRFLDFSVIIVNQVAHLSHYNPFSNTLHEVEITNDTELFPDKLRDMHGWKLTFPLMHYPISAIVTNTSGSLTISGNEYPFFPIFAKALNFKLDIAEKDWQENTWIFNNNETGLHKLIADDNIDGMMVSFVANSRMIGNLVSQGKTYVSGPVVIIVPIMQYDLTELSWGRHLVVIGVIFILILADFLIRFTKLPRQNYGIIDMYQNFLGLSASTTPTSRIGTINLIAIVILSIVCSSELFTILTDIQLISRELELDTFEQMDKANLTLYIPQYYRQMVQHIDNIAFKNLLKRKIFIAEPENCLFELYKKKRCGCFADATSAEYYVKHQGSSPTFKVSKARFFTDFFAFPFHEGSPYVDKINDLQQKIIEGGLPKINSPLWGYEVAANQSSDFDKNFTVQNDNQVGFALISLASLGFGISILIFVVELCYRFIIRKRIVTRFNR